MTGLADSTGAKGVAYTYGPWGEAWGVSGTLASTLGAMNPLRYRGYVYDAETGLYYLNSRYYNPIWGRFINADDGATENRDFWALLNSERLTEEYRKFEEEYLIDFAKKWCQKNGIPCTDKPIDFRRWKREGPK